MAHSDDHGNSVAGWTLALGELAAALVAGIGFSIREEVWIWAGVILAVVVFIAWRVLIAAGLGDPKHVGPPIVAPAGERALAHAETPSTTRETR